MKYLNADVMKGFVGSVLSKRFDGSVPSPTCHYEWWELCTSDARNVAIAAPRGFAKSTAVTVSITLASILFRERQFALIVSDTEAQASGFLQLIKQEICENEDLQKLFKFKKNDKGEIAFIKETESDLIGQFEDGHKFRIVAKGSEQKLRGLLWNGLRPDLIMCDDMENDEIVMNKDRREKFKRWFYGALLPARSRYGLVRYVGTILHMDSMLENLMPVESDKNTVVEDLKIWTTKREVWKSVKYRAHTDDFTKLLWPEKHSAGELKAQREDYKQRGLLDVYAQEMLNIPIDESTSFFKRADFRPLHRGDLEAHVNFYVTVDLAISQKQKADYSVFVIAGVDEEKRIQVRNVIRERLDGRDIVDTLISIQRLYNPVAIGIEESQISKSIGPFLNEAMYASGVYISLEKLKHMSQDKLTRTRSIQARMRAHGVRFDKDQDWYQPFEDELIRFPRDKHDDQVDAFAYLGLMLDRLVEAPTVKEQMDMDYYEDLEKTGVNEIGRNQTTGY